MSVTATEWAEIKTLRTDKKKCGEQARSLVAKCQTENRDMSAEEKETFDKLATKVEQIDETVQKLEKMAGDEEETDADEPDTEDTDTSDSDDERGNRISGERRSKPLPIGVNANRNDNPSRGTKRSKNHVNVVQRIGESREGFVNRQRRSQEEYFNDCMRYVQFGSGALSNARALQADVDIVGGYLILPEQISDKILKKVDDILFIRKYATVMKVENARSMGVPTLEADPDDADWTTEIATINQDNSMSFGKRSMVPSPIRKRLLVSERLLRMAFATAFQSNDTENGKGGSTDGLIINRLAYKLARTQENAFFNGNGVNKPLGMFAASSRGISTGRDVVTGSATTFTYAGLMNIKYTLKVQYQATARWFLHRLAMREIMKLVDSNGRSLLDFSTIPNQPDTLLQRPVDLSEMIPATFTTGLYVGMLCDPSFYNIVDSQEVTIKQADQLYAETGQIGYFITAESDGMPVLEEAFVRIKLS